MPVFVMVMVMMLVSVMLVLLVTLMMVMMFMMALMFVFMMMVILVRMRVSMRHAISMRVFVAMFMREMNIEFDSFDSGLVGATDVQVISVQLEFPQLLFQFVRIDPQINERGDEHVAADATENIQVECFHLLRVGACARPLIWLAA